MCYTETSVFCVAALYVFYCALLWHSGRIYIPTGSMLITLSCNSKYPCLSLLEIEIIKCILINPIIIFFPNLLQFQFFLCVFFQIPADVILTIPVSSKQHLQINWTALLNGRLCVYEIKKIDLWSIFSQHWAFLFTVSTHEVFFSV